MSEKEYPDGIIVRAPRDGAPDFVKANISIKRKDLGNWLRGKEDEWINLAVKERRDGKWYVEVDNWKPKPKPSDPGQPSRDDPNDPIPF